MFIGGTLRIGGGLRNRQAGVRQKRNGCLSKILASGTVR
jgi:hypothetical protein